MKGVFKMTLLRFEPLRDLEHFSNRIQNFFNDFNPDMTFNPRVDISEDDKNIFIEVEAPGVKKEDVKLTIEDNILTISGEKKNEKEEKEGKNYYRTERMYGSFQRSFTLPADINRDNIDAKFEHGILKIVVEKVQPKSASEKTIEVK
jgi:HSP20 family protein